MVPDYYKDIKKKYNFSPSQYELSKHLFLDSLIFGGIYLCLKQEAIVFYIAAQLLWPILFFRFFGLMHDGVHSSISKNIKLNNLIGYISGAFCFLPYYPWKKMHLQHHYWSGNVEKDPVMRIIKEFDSGKKIKNNFLEFAWKSWVPLLALMQHAVFWLVGISYFKQAKDVRSKFRWMLSYLIPGFIYYQLYKMNMFTLTQLGPGLFIYLMMTEIINFPHHLELPQNHGDKTLPVWEQYQVSRSCFYPKWFARIILNNFNYHTEHHMFPTAPWYQLDQIQIEVRNFLKSEYNHSLGNEWILKNRKKDIQSLLIYKDNKNAEGKYKSKIIEKESNEKKSA